jgi:hypothetical protein
LVLGEQSREHALALVSLELLLPAPPVDDLRAATGRTFLDAAQWDACLRAAGAEPVLHLCPGGESLGVQVLAARFGADRCVLAPASIREAVCALLPPAMVPARFDLCAALPLSGVGKVDRRRLRSWIEPVGRPEEAEGVAPRGDLEEAVGREVARLLDRSSVPRDLSFLELGGDSLLAAQLVTRLREGVPGFDAHYFDDLLRHLIKGADVASLARVVQNAPNGSSEPDPYMRLRVVAEGDLPGWVLVPDGTGLLGSTLEAAPLLRGHLVAPELERPDALDDADSERLASELALALVERYEGPFSLVAGRWAWPQALELGRWLTEAGVEVRRLLLVEPAELPPPTDELSRDPARLALYERTRGGPEWVPLDIAVIGGSADMLSSLARRCLGDLRRVGWDEVEAD